MPSINIFLFVFVILMRTYVTTCTWLGYREDFAFFREGKEMCSNYIPNHHLIHLPTFEGLVSHIEQLTNLWIISQNIFLNKTIIEVPFQSEFHYIGVQKINMCDILLFPQEIVCACDTVKEIGPKQSYCPVLQNLTDFSIWAQLLYGLDASRNTEFKFDVDLHEVECIAGFVHFPRYEKILHENPMHVYIPVQFQDKYVRLLSLLRASDDLPLQSDFIAVHWRRGDQLISRCIGLIGSDKSVNCGTSTDFISKVRSRINELPEQAQHLPVYVSTNEVNETNIHALHRAGFLTSTSIVDTLRGKLDLKAHELFAIELMLLCESSFYFSWGFTSAQEFIKRCKRSKTERADLTLWNKIYSKT